MKVAITAALFTSVVGMSTRRFAMSQLTCSELISLGHRFSWNSGQTDVCVAVKIPNATGDTQCRVSSEG
jgi:hypothetical protein